MSVIVKGGGESNYTPHPEGQYAAQCIDVVDMGWQRTTFGPKYKIRIVFYCGKTEAREFEGVTKDVPLTVVGFFTASLHEKSNLRAFARSWRGADFSDDEVRGGFDFDNMVGAPAFLQVEQSSVDGKTYANIVSVMRLPEGMSAPASPDYERVCEREGWQGPASHPDEMTSRTEPDPSESAPNYTDPDDDLPFRLAA